MRALVVVPQPFFTPRGTPLSVYYRTLVTAELGVQVDLLTYGQGRDVDIPGVRILRLPPFRRLGAVRTGPSALKLFLDLCLVARALPLLARGRYDFVHAHEEAAFFFLGLKPVFRYRLVYDMHSSLPQQLTNFGFTRSRPLIGLFERLEGMCLRGCEAVITVCPQLAAHATARMADPGRHFLIENTISEPVRLRAEPSLAAPSHELPPGAAGRPIVAYAGTFQPYQGLDLLIPAFARVRERRPDAFLLLVGGAPDEVERYRRLAAASGLDGHVWFTGSVDPATARGLVRHATLVVSPRTRGMNTPLKIYEQMAGGIPLVATRVLAHTQVLDDEVAFLVEPEPEALAAGILEGLADEPRRRAMAERARARYRERYSREAYVQGMRRVLEAVA